MTIVALTDNRSRLNFFQERILLNIDYWRSYLSHHEITALDAERNQIIKAIAFALGLQEAWPSVYELMLSFSPYMERRGSLEGWNQYLGRAINVAQQVQDTGGVITLSLLLGRLLQRQNCLAEAISQYRWVIRLARGTNYDFEEARACTNMGYLYIERGQWWRAEILCCHALVLFEQLDNAYGRAHTENHLSVLYMRQGLWDKAQQCLERACTIWEGSGDSHGLMYGFLNLGVLYLHMEEPDKSLSYSEKALHQAELSGEELAIGSIYANLSLAYKIKRDWVNAEAYSHRAKAIFQRFSNAFRLAIVQDDLGVIYLEQQKWTEANSCLAAALEAWRLLNNKYEEIQTMIHFIQYELARGDQTQALAWLTEAEDQLSQHDPARQYYQLQTQLDKFRRSLTQKIAGPTAAD
jgi:tetratricopeptide (TPR) repeat protein